MKCIRCGALIVKPQRKYCLICKKAKRAEEHLAWCRKHPESQVNFRKKNSDYAAKKMREYNAEHPEKHNHGKDRDYGNEAIYLKPQDGNEWDMHHIDTQRVIPVLHEIHSAFSHMAPVFTLEGVLG